MWWMIPIAITGYVVRKTIENGKKRSSSAAPSTSYKSPTTLEANLSKLKIKLDATTKKKIAIIGQPGAGKSSLLNQLTNGACIPTPTIGPQTDHTDWSRNTNVTMWHTYQDIIFVDAPGYNTVNHPTSSFVSMFPFQSFDRILVVVNGKVHQSDEKVWSKLIALKERGEIMLIRTFAESLESTEEQEVTTDLQRVFGHKATLVSNRNKTGLEAIKKFI
jgi:predicted GTPase